jgi:hypothetical protein
MAYTLKDDDDGDDDDDDDDKIECSPLIRSTWETVKLL